MSSNNNNQQKSFRQQIEDLKKPPLEIIAKQLSRISGQSINHRSPKAILASYIVDVINLLQRNNKTVFDRVYNVLSYGINNGFTGTDGGSTHYYTRCLDTILPIVQTANAVNGQQSSRSRPSQNNRQTTRRYGRNDYVERNRVRFDDDDDDPFDFLDRDDYISEDEFDEYEDTESSVYKSQSPHQEQRLPHLSQLINEITPIQGIHRNVNLPNGTNRLPPPISFNNRFTSSPFYTTINVISSDKLIHQSSSKATVTLNFTLSKKDSDSINERDKLKSPDQWLGLNLFCGRPGLKGDKGLSIIEFPPVSEVRVNGVLQKGNLKGIKNKPGTTAPLDITTSCRLVPNVNNRVDITYTLTSIDYYMCVHLVEQYSVDSLSLDIKKKRFRPLEYVKLNLFNTQNEDDIVTLQSSLSLKDPLTLTRIKTPVRSKTCNHAQCFEATAFLSMNRQTPTWDCPVCHKNIVSIDHLICDGFFLDILNDPQTENIDQVLLSPDGCWMPPRASAMSVPVKSQKRQNGAVAITLEVSDSEDDGFEFLHRATAPQAPIIQPSPVSNLLSAPEVIDLTFSD